ncbi:uncharacterized protein MONBRDRAFT_9521 [Monosiga brevicollis MX1]|uniref:Sulphur transport domain-containing protein n=1 Tax=Monosiga brevicollis TaxID=81824 RepID=A9V3E9_MONBE|nr:uncharacterized protein MONBRDRAFT_9521 [Monosiga brevicollis MX1]EDQ88176.1 predicted protein [Monosiga brevicollis MX1]|eukprot:XP_001747252.1 hypothetical protein [Monosiga brevicollis MX1]
MSLRNKHAASADAMFPSDHKAAAAMSMPAPSSFFTKLGQVVAASAMGLFFGWAMEKGKVTEPMVIRDQMGMTRFTMMKMFLSAVVAARVVLERMLAQAKAARTTAIHVVRGTINHTRSGDEVVFVDEKLGSSYAKVAVGFSIMLATMIGLLEYLLPWTSEVPRDFARPVGDYLAWHAWSPIVSGAIVGSMQIPAILFIGDTLGSSTSYMTLCAQTSGLPFIKQTCGHLCKFKSGMGNWWQVFYIAMAALAASVSARMGATEGAVIPGAAPGAAVFGGILMLVGSRLAGGCTSGHGLSGMGLMCINSFVAVAAMFGGGMVAQQILVATHLG